MTYREALAMELDRKAQRLGEGAFGMPISLITKAARERLTQLEASPELLERLTEAMFIVPFHGEMNRDFVRRQARAALTLLNED